MYRTGFEWPQFKPGPIDPNTYSRFGAVIRFTRSRKVLTWYLAGTTIAKVVENDLGARIFAVAGPAMAAVAERSLVKPKHYRAFFDNDCVVSKSARSCATGAYLAP